jgi:hypothetical protein
MRRRAEYEPKAEDWPHATPDDWPQPGDTVRMLKGVAAGLTAVVLHTRRGAACELLPDARVLMVRIKAGTWVKMDALPEPGLLEKIG